MRPRTPLPLLLAAVSLALPAAAQVKTGAVAADAAAGTGQVGTSLSPGGIAPVGGLNASSLSPLSLTPVLAAPAASLNQGLAPSALVATPVKAAASADPVRPVAAAAATPPKTPPNVPPAAAAPGPPGGPPFFVQQLVKLGVASDLALRLQTFLDSRHPGDQDKVYHGLGHSHEVADLAARVVAGQNLPVDKQILLIVSAALHDVDPERAANTPARVSATLAHLDEDDAARALLLDFGTRHGFTAAQVKAMIMATDFAMDPAQMKEKQDAFAKAAAEAFPSEPGWALAWGKRLAFSDQISTYVGSLEQAKARVRGLALEIRAQLEAIGKGPGPTDEVMLAGSFKFLDVLKQSPEFALLPAEQRKNFALVLDYFQSRQTPESWKNDGVPPPARAPPASPDLEAARRYIREIMGSRAPTEREADALLGDWLEEQGIPRGSPRAADVRAGLLPSRAAAEADATSKLRPELRRHAAVIIKLAAEYKQTPAGVEAMLARSGLLGHLDIIPDDQFETQARMALDRAELARAVKNYPETEQGELMRAVADTMGTRGGKSVEEVARDGVFVYSDFVSGKPIRAYVSRDPDIRTSLVAFYVTRRDGRWNIGVYRQNRQTRTSDATFEDSFKAWLRAGRVPPGDLR